MLVLLIIFMVTAPLMTSGVSVDLPKTNAQPLNSDSEPLTVSIKADGSIFLQDQAIDIADMVAKLQAIAQNNPDRRIFVRGDKDLAYGRIMEVMGTITQGGFTKVALLAEQTGRHPPPRHHALSPSPAHTPPSRRRVTRMRHAAQSIECRLPAWQATDVLLSHRVTGACCSNSSAAAIDRPIVLGHDAAACGPG